MKIGMVVHGFPPYDRAGTEIYTAALARELSKRNEVVIICPRYDAGYDHGQVREEALGGQRVVFINYNPSPDRYPFYFFDEIMENSFAMIIEQEQPDVVHWQHFIRCTFGFADLLVEKNIPMVYTLHDYYPICWRCQMMRPDCTVCSGPENGWGCVLCQEMLRAGDELGRHIYHAVSKYERSQPLFARFNELYQGRSHGFNDNDRVVMADQFVQRHELFAKFLEQVKVICSPSIFLGEKVKEYFHGHF